MNRLSSLSPSSTPNDGSPDTQVANSTDQIDDAHIPLISLSQSRPNEKNSGHLKRLLPESLPSVQDGAIIAIVLAAFAGAILAIVPNSVASYLGQTNQLIVVGFCLSVMALCCQQQVNLTALIIEAHSGRMTVQNCNALLQNSPTATGVGWLTRSLLLLMNALPLALSVGYKRFVDGESTTELLNHTGYFGLVPPLGYERIGLGYSHITNLYTPFWTSPGLNHTYGFNLFVESNNTSAALDAPFPQSVASVQQNLGPEDSFTISATVIGSVAEIDPLSDSERCNSTWWRQIRRNQSAASSSEINLYYGRRALLNIGATNSSKAFASFWNVTNKEKPECMMNRVSLSRRRCNGTWRITKSNATLIGAAIIDTESHAMETVDQSLIQDNQLELARLYGPMLTEYDWIRYPRELNVDTLPSLIAVMFWARTVTMCSISNPEKADNSSKWNKVNHYFKNWSEIKLLVTRKTLKRDNLLILILTVNPVLVIFATFLKLCFHPRTIDENFGLVSILTAVNQKGLALLKGAATSGKLTRNIYMRFKAPSGPRSTKHDHIEINLEEEAAT